MSPKRNRIQAMLDDDLCERLQAAAAKDKRTVSDYVRLILEEHLGGTNHG